MWLLSFGNRNIREKISKLSSCGAHEELRHVVMVHQLEEGGRGVVVVLTIMRVFV